MRPFQTIAQIIIATSVVNCAPVPAVISNPQAEPTAPATYPRAENTVTPKNKWLGRLDTTDGRILAASVFLAPLALFGLAFGIYKAIPKGKGNGYVRSFPTLSCHANISDLRSPSSNSAPFIPSNTTSSLPSNTTSSLPSNTTISRSIRSSENDAILRRLAKLADKEPRFVSLISRRAIESLD